MQLWQKVKGGIVNISQDYNAAEKLAMTAHLRAVVHANFKDVCRKQETRREKKMSRKFIIDREEQVLKIIAATKEYKNPIGFSSVRKSELKNIVTGSVVSSEHLNDIVEARAKGKEHLDYFINERFFEEKMLFWDSVKKLNLKTFPSGDKPIACRKKSEAITLKTDVNLFSWLITVNRDDTSICKMLFHISLVLF